MTVAMHCAGTFHSLRLLRAVAPAARWLPLALLAPGLLGAAVEAAGVTTLRLAELLLVDLVVLAFVLVPVLLAVRAALFEVGTALAAAPCCLPCCCWAGTGFSTVGLALREEAADDVTLVDVVGLAFAAAAGLCFAAAVVATCAFVGWGVMLASAAAAERHW